MEWGELYREDGITKKYIPVHQGQADILASTARFRAIIAGVSSGKTTCGAIDLGLQVQRKPKGKFLIVAPTFKILESATLPTWLKYIEGTGLDGGPDAHKIQAKEYRLPTGGVIYLRSADHPDSFEGLQLDGGAWLDEGGQVSVKVWHAIQRRTGFHKAPVLITTTPYPNYTWLKGEFIERANAGNRDYFVRQFPSTLNPKYDQEEFDRAKRELPEWKFKMFYLGEYVGAQGMVYPDMPRCFVDLKDFAAAGVTGTYYAGVDWGGGTQTADPFSCLVGCLDANDVLWVFFERYVSGERNDLMTNAQRLKEWHQEFKKKTGEEVRCWWADASRPTSISLFRKMAGLTCRKANNQAGAIATGVDLVTARIKTDRLKIVKETCKGLIKESELYRYATGEDEEAHGDTPKDAYNHAMDALRYLVMGIDRKRSPYSVDS